VNFSATTCALAWRRRRRFPTSEHGIALPLSIIVIVARSKSCSFRFEFPACSSMVTFGRRRFLLGTSRNLPDAVVRCPDKTPSRASVSGFESCPKCMHAVAILRPRAGNVTFWGRMKHLNDSFDYQRSSPSRHTEATFQSAKPPIL
jgi:hypothetical protein